LPEGIADHGSRQATTAAIVGSGEYAAHQGPHTEYLEKIAADEKALSKPTFARGSEAETITAPGENAGEHVLLVAEYTGLVRTGYPLAWFPLTPVLSAS